MGSKAEAGLTCMSIILDLQDVMRMIRENGNTSTTWGDLNGSTQQ